METVRRQGILEHRRNRQETRRKDTSVTQRKKTFLKERNTGHCRKFKTKNWPYVCTGSHRPWRCRPLRVPGRHTASSPGLDQLRLTPRAQDLQERELEADRQPSPDVVQAERRHPACWAPAPGPDGESEELPGWPRGQEPLSGQG